MELWKPEKVHRRGSIRHFKTPSGHSVIVLPTCGVPLEHLAPENWANEEYRGIVRSVLRVPRLKQAVREEIEKKKKQK